MFFQDIEIEQNTPVITAISDMVVAVINVMVSSYSSICSALIMII